MHLHNFPITVLCLQALDPFFFFFFAAPHYPPAPPSPPREPNFFLKLLLMFLTLQKSCRGTTHHNNKAWEISTFHSSDRIPAAYKSVFCRCVKTWRCPRAKRLQTTKNIITPNGLAPLNCSHAGLKSD